MWASISWQLPERIHVGPLWSYPALHPVVGLVLEVGAAEKFPQALGLKSQGLLLPQASESASKKKKKDFIATRYFF